MQLRQRTYKNEYDTIRAVIAKATNGTPVAITMVDYYPGGMAMPNRNIVGDYRYDYQGQEKDEETGKVAFQLRLYDARINRWISPDPTKQYASPYLSMGNNWVNRADPDGGEDNPVFDKEGNLLGYTESGNTGVALIFDDPNQFVEGMPDSDAFAIGNILDLGVDIGNCLIPGAKAKIFETFLDGMIFNDGTKYSKGDAIITTNSDAVGNARYLGLKNGKHQVNFDIGEYEWTVENIRATFIHELEGHGFNGFTSALDNHHKAYFASMDSRYWSGTTDAYKKHEVYNMWRYYSDEVGPNLPIKYYYMYKNNINKLNPWMGN